MPLRHHRTKYKTQLSCKTVSSLEQKNLAKPHQRQLILDYIELACNKTEPSVCFHSHFVLNCTRTEQTLMAIVKVTVTNCNKLDDDFIDMGTQCCFRPCEHLSNLPARPIFSDLSDFLRFVGSAVRAPRFYILWHWNTCSSPISWTRPCNLSPAHARNNIEFSGRILLQFISSYYLLDEECLIGLGEKSKIKIKTCTLGF